MSKDSILQTCLYLFSSLSHLFFSLSLPCLVLTLNNKVKTSFTSIYQSVFYTGGFNGRSSALPTAPYCGCHSHSMTTLLTNLLSDKLKHQPSSYLTSLQLNFFDSKTFFFHSSQCFPLPILWSLVISAICLVPKDKNTACFVNQDNYIIDSFQ